MFDSYPGRAKDSPKKRKRDVNKPKRSTSAYFFFLAHKREESKRAGRSISKVKTDIIN